MMFAIGSNSSGQLGVGHTQDLSNPSPVAFPGLDDHSSIRQIAAGGNHTLVVFQDGSVYAFGSNEHNQLGLTGPSSPLPIRQRWPAPETSLPSVPNRDGPPVKVVQVSATWSTSNYLCDDNGIATSGDSNNGERGLGVNWRRSSGPTAIPLFPPKDTKVVQIASCIAHTVVVLSNGEVYGWGKGRKGQLGEPVEDVWSPRKIAGVGFHAVKAVCGKDFTCLVGDVEQGELLVLGPTRNDRFGIRENAPKAVPGWKEIAASWGSVFVLLQSGELIAWGRNDHGQLPPPDLPSIESIAAGSEHCLALTKAGKVLAWGWGEHGNCGEPTDSDGDVKGRWNQIELPHPVSAIHAGCATSFFVTINEPELCEAG